MRFLGKRAWIDDMYYNFRNLKGKFQVSKKVSEVETQNNNDSKVNLRSKSINERSQKMINIYVEVENADFKSPNRKMSTNSKMIWRK